MDIHTSRNIFTKNIAFVHYFLFFHGINLFTKYIATLAWEDYSLSIYIRHLYHYLAISELGRGEVATSKEMS